MPTVVPDLMTTQNYEDRRNAPRHECDVAAIISDRDGQVLAACRIKDISDSGARIKLNAPIELPPEFIIVDSDSSIRCICETRWRIDNQMGLQFRKAFSVEQVTNFGAQPSLPTTQPKQITSKVLKRPIVVR